MKYSILFSAFLLTCGFSSCFAQTDEKGNVTVTYSKVQYNRTPKESKIFNLIKINPLMIFNGDIPIYFERRLADKYSVEVGVGITYTDYIYEIGQVDETYYNTDFERKSTMGYSFSASFKYYPSNYTKALEDFYFGPEIRYRKYNTQVTDCGFTSSSGFIPESRVTADFKFTVGYITYISDMVMVDFYGGIGMRKRNISRAYCEDNGAMITMVYDNIDDIVPAISAGFKFGFGF